MRLIWYVSLIVFFSYSSLSIAHNAPNVTTGIDRLFSEPYLSLLQGKRIGVVTNHTAVNSEMSSTMTVMQAKTQTGGYTISAFFAPEHGLYGSEYASESIKDHIITNDIPVYSLHGDTRRPTDDMLSKIDTLVFDVQDIGCRSYTYASTLFYVMEEAAKKGIPVIVTDRPNPINGIVVDGPMLQEKFRSFVGYINVPYCHGMTIGELANFFNGEYNVGCNLHVIPMTGWNRTMSFKETGLAWIPTSPQIPEAETTLFYPTTGPLGEIPLVSIGIGYSLPFKVVGAPWINSELFVKHLNAAAYPGVTFYPFHFRPFFGRFAKEACQGALILVTDPTIYKPITTQYLILGVLKSLYPDKVNQAVAAMQPKMFHSINGTDEVYNIIKNEKYIIWKLRELHHKERQQFLEKRQKYLIADYSPTHTKVL